MHSCLHSVHLLSLADSIETFISSTTAGMPPSVVNWPPRSSFTDRKLFLIVKWPRSPTRAAADKQTHKGYVVA